jgi:hypothetical protein
VQRRATTRKEMQRGATIFRKKDLTELRPISVSKELAWRAGYAIFTAQQLANKLFRPLKNLNYFSGYASIWQTLPFRMARETMNYHDSNHGSEETARKPVNETTSDSITSKATRNGRNPRASGNQRRRRFSKRARWQNGSAVKQHKKSGATKRPVWESQKEVKMVLKAISECAGKRAEGRLPTARGNSAEVPESLRPRVRRHPGNQNPNNAATESASRSIEAKPKGEIIDKKELMRRLPKSLRTICYWMAEGRIPFHKAGRSVLFDWEEVRAALIKG